jgi:predicted flap endonuclease-1-like 5' DNA nuclease
MLEQRKDETFFEYWVSFWPVAPFFGVRWRFEGMAPGFEAFSPTTEAAKPEAPAAPPVEAAPPETVSVEPAASAADAVVVDAEPEPVASPAAAEIVDVEPAPAATPDDLTQIKGVGPKLQTLLNDLGVYRFEQIAGFDDADLARIDAQLGTFKGRPFRDGWIEQAKSLM